jgi:hypothetical protein
MQTKFPAEICAEQISVIPAMHKVHSIGEKFLDKLNHLLLRGVWSNFFDVLFKSSYEPVNIPVDCWWRNFKLFVLDFAQPVAYAEENVDVALAANVGSTAAALSLSLQRSSWVAR